MLLQQVLEELSTKRGEEDEEDKEKKKELELSHSNAKPNTTGNLIKDTNHVSNDINYIKNAHKGAPNPARTVDVKRSSAPLTRHTGSTNAHYLYRAAIAAKEIQSSHRHSRLSAPALLANCLLSMISLSDDDDLADTIEDDLATSTGDVIDTLQGRNTILKSFSQLRAEERNGKEALINHNDNLYSNHKKLEIVSCCLFPCKRNISSKTMGSTLELLHNSDELSSSNDDGNSRSGMWVIGGGSACVPCNLGRFVKRVLCKGSSEAGTRSSVGDNMDMIFDDDHPGLNTWAGTPISNQSRVNQDELDHNVDKYLHYDHNEYMYNTSDSLLHVDNIAGGYNYGVVKAGGRSTAVALEMSGGEAAQEVVHEVISLSHDAPIASSFVFDQSCFSSPSSTSNCMKLETSHPWLVSTGDLDSCSTSPLHMHNIAANANETHANHGALLVMQDDLQKRLANKRLNLSR